MLLSKKKNIAKSHVYGNMYKKLAYIDERMSILKANYSRRP